MKTLIALALACAILEAKSTAVRGHVKPRSGKYVEPHVRTAPNKTQHDNYGTKGNSNPRTGKSGTRTPKK
jgi:hypothetical protein